MAEVRVLTHRVTQEWSDTFLYLNGQLHEWIDMQYTPMLNVCGTTGLSPVAHDLLLLAVATYAMDKASPRQDAADAWTRDLCLTVPVKSEAFLTTRPLLEDCLSYLTGDRWSLHFTLHPMRQWRPLVQPTRNRGTAWNIGAVSLFSGGVDSLIGIIDWLESRSGRILLVGHHDGSVPGPLHDQQRLLGVLQRTYPGRVEAILIRAGMRVPGPAETTYRSRSFLFLALALQAFLAVTPSDPLLVPENGTIAYNVPLTPSRGGSCSTRTTHPTYLAMWEQCVRALGLSHGTPILDNPLQGNTKGESIQTCRNPDLLRKLMPHAISCGKRGHRATWVRRDAAHCGRCVPCIYRRAALHRCGWDIECYGTDICAGEVPLFSREERLDEGAKDLRAFVTMLRDGSISELELGLLANGRLTAAQLREGLGVSRRALDEVRMLLTDKATAEVRRQAGLTRTPRSTRSAPERYA